MQHKSSLIPTKGSKDDSVLLFKPKYDHISEVSSVASTSSSSSTSHRPKVVSSEVHLPPTHSSNSPVFHVYKSGKWKAAPPKSDEEPIINKTTSEDDDDTISSAASVEKVKKKQRRARSSSSSTTTTTTSEQYNTSPMKEESMQASVASDASEKGIAEPKFLGIYIHQTSDLKFDAKIRDPQVVVTLVDLKTGQMAVYSQETLKQKQLEQPFILPETTSSCKFISKIALRCQWENLIFFKETLDHLKIDDYIIFFEILQDLGPDEDPYGLAWAFLRPLNENQFEPMQGQRLKLQLYCYRKLSKRMKISQNTSVYNQWSAKQRKKYPGCLEITVKSLIQAQIEEKPKPLEVEDLTNIANLPFYQVPSEFVSKVRLTKKGCLLTKFSSCGKYLAFNDDTDICVILFPSLQVIHNLQGHKGLIHDLDWKDDGLLSASADKTVILWKFDATLGVLSRVMPHPSFVYCAKFAGDLVLTGGRDAVIRVWKCDTPVPQLLQEVEEHSEYITSLLYVEGTVFSSDSRGLIIEWKIMKTATLLKKEQEFSLAELRNKKILSMTTHKRGKIFFLVHDDCDIFALSLPGALLRRISLKNEPNRIHQQISFSPCGRYIFCSDHERVLAYDLTGDKVHTELKVPAFRVGTNFISSISNNFNYLCVAVYGTGGGLVIFKNNSSQALLPEPPATQRKQYRSTNEHTGYLAEVIERIDHLLLDGEPLHREEASQEKIDETDEEEEYTQASEGSENRTYSVSEKSESKKEFPEIMEVKSFNENLTFSIHSEKKDKEKEVYDNLTFSIEEKADNDEDDTTISESIK